jgi:hypothetical protein
MIESVVIVDLGRSEQLTGYPFHRCSDQLGADLLFVVGIGIDQRDMDLAVPILRGRDAYRVDLPVPQAIFVAG